MGQHRHLSRYIMGYSFKGTYLRGWQWSSSTARSSDCAKGASESDLEPKTSTKNHLGGWAHLHRFLLMGMRPSFCENPQSPPPMMPSTRPHVTQRTRSVVWPRNLAAGEVELVTSFRWCTNTRPAWRPNQVTQDADSQPRTPSGS